MFLMKKLQISKKITKRFSRTLANRYLLLNRKSKIQSHESVQIKIKSQNVYNQQIVYAKHFIQGCTGKHEKI